MFDYNTPSIILEMITANNTVVMFLCRKMYKKNRKQNKLGRTKLYDILAPAKRLLVGTGILL